VLGTNITKIADFDAIRNRPKMEKSNFWVVIKPVEERPSYSGTVVYAVKFWKIWEDCVSAH